MKKKKKGLSKGVKALLIIIIVICLAVIGFCAYKILGIKQGYADAENYYNDLEQAITAGKDNGTDSVVIGPNNTANENTEKETVATIGGVPVDELYPDNPGSLLNPLASDDDTGLPDNNAGNAGSLLPNVVAEDIQTVYLGGTELNPEADYIAPAGAAEKLDAREKAVLLYKKHVKRAADIWYYVSPVLQKKIRMSDILTKHASIKWDYDAFYEICEDAAGYIYQEDTMSYPIVQAADNNKYLRHLINGEYNVAGTLFVDCHYEDGLENRYSVVYGHNMDDKSMFGSITSYKNEEYYEQHPYFEIYTPEGQYAYYVYAAGQVSVDDDVFTVNLNDEDFLKLMDSVKELRSYEMNPPVHVSEKSKVLVLSTCIDYPRDYNYRYVVVLVRGEPLLDKVDTDKE